MASLNYQEIVQKIESLGVMPEGPPSLEPMQKGMQRLLSHLSLRPERTVVVAGTNGKGSVCASLEALLIDAGQTVGLYTSPHLEETTERIRVNGVDISRENFSETYRQVSERTKGLKLSHFETLTLMAVWFFYFGGKPLDWMIFEVGLGGTWDATNAIPHYWNIITTLGLDHQNILGKSLYEIAENKFGIIGNKTEVVHSPFPDELQDLAEKTRQGTSSRWTKSMEFSTRVEKSEGGPVFILNISEGEIPLSLSGNRAAQNAATALTLFRELGFSPQKHLQALRRVRWPGRMERISEKKYGVACPVYLSGDHNPSGVASLLELLSFYEWERLYILVGVGKDKDADGVLKPLFDLKNTSIVLTETPFRGKSIHEYGPWSGKALRVEQNETAFQFIAELAQPRDMILVTVSLYLVGLMRSRLHAALSS